MKNAKWAIVEWFDGHRYNASFQGVVYQAKTKDEAFALAYTAKCVYAGF